ncbi:hypothetical protein GCM10007276_02890 [Agaricicola taiwanensis]|uniref:MmgE/PrpD family protein n=1 Tax=Agaricicola taiwanensis TaxID=591372 RepID=A0A8J2VKX2_9RHOB|nr:MmgE/PrpD family protein [Agaricicola taiwanensis]GGE29159.1 hypothetical protein GCM10007276_02890 [Agaricicola taiwanensis]
MLHPDMKSVTRAYGEFVSQTRWDALPNDARELSKQAIADCIGGAIAGFTEPPTIAALSVAEGEEGTVPVWGCERRTNERTAALINGTMAHAHDIDDTNESMRGHPSAPVVPAIFAAAPRAKADGKAIITAYAVGVEIEAKLGRAMNMEHYERGWHTTSTLGTMGASAAVSNLLQLDADTSAIALSIAASMACGLRANFGTMTKPLHSGLAAQNGVLSAVLAAKGLSANPKTIEAKEGFFDLFAGFENIAVEKALVGLGEPFDVVSPGIIFKLYPTCSLTHHVLDVVLEGIRSGDIVPAKMSRLNCGIGYRCENTLPYHNAETGLEGKFSMEYCIAAALQYGQVTFAEFSDDKVNNPEIRALYPKLNIYVHDDLRERDSVFNDFADIEVVHEDGRTFKRRLYKPKGHPTNPLSWQELEQKFVTCASPVIGGAETATIWAKLRGLDGLTADEVLEIFKKSQ